MPKVGNDIVDLNLAEKESNWQKPGFLEKQFTQKEQEVIKNSENPFEQVWLFWSMKEAAYKCYTQTDAKRFFAPKKFQCSLTSEDTGIVLFDNQKFYTSSDIDYYIHTTARDFLIENPNEIVMFAGIGSPHSVDDSIAKRLQEETGISGSEIEKRKTNIGAPQFYHQENLLTSSCSISHHGNYGAYVFML